MTTLTPEEFNKKYGSESLAKFDEMEQSRGFWGRFGSSLKESFTKGKAEIQGTGEFADSIAPVRGVQLAGTGAMALPKAVMAGLTPEPVQKWLGENVGQPISKGFNTVTDVIGSSPSLQKFVSENPTATKIIEETMKVTGGLAETASGLLATKGMIDTAKTLASATQTATTKVPELVSASREKLSTLINKSPKLTDAPSNIMQRVARVSKANQMKFEGMAKESIGQYLTKRNIFGNVDEITEKLASRWKKYMGMADDELAKLKGTYSPEPVKTMLKELMDREELVSTQGAPSKIMGQLQNLSSKSEWTMSEINAIKRLYEGNVKVDYLRTINPTGVARATNLDTAVRTWQLQQAKTLGLKNLDVINRETRLARSLLDTLGKEYAGSAGNNWMGLSDWIVLAGGDPTAVASFLVKRGFSSKDVQSWIARYLNKGKAPLENVAAETGPSQIPQLPPASSGFRSSMPSGQPIKVAPTGSNIEITSKTGITSPTLKNVVGFNASNPIDTPQEIVQGFINRTKAILSDSDLVELAKSQKDLMLQGLKKDIIDGLKGSGFAKQSQQIAGQLKNVNTLEDLAKIKITASKPTTPRQ